MELAELIFSWAEINILYLAAVHLNGELNTLTYTLSREQFSHTEWNLNQEPRSVHYDHSKMRQTFLLPQRTKRWRNYFRCTGNQNSLGLNAFIHPWVGNFLYAFPLQAHSQSLAEDHIFGGKGVSDSPSVAEKVLVCDSPKTVDVRSL